MMDEQGVFAIRAPGKVILFGEHAVVHGVPAIAASIGLNTYLVVSESSDINTVELDFTAVGLKARWDTQSLPFTANARIDELIAPEKEIRDRLEKLTEVQAKNAFEQAAALTFLYLYTNICTSTAPGRKFTIKSELPIGAGLGSSGSFSVCLATALLILSGQINPATNVHCEQELELINKWAYIGECIIHGQPSGIDNIVSTRGGAVKFQRQSNGTSLSPYDTFPTVNLLLTDTKVPRMTSHLVAGVGKLKNSHPDVVLHILESIRELVTEADNLLRKTPYEASIAAELGSLADINHGLLVALGVSHPSLEKVRSITSEMNIGNTKLTGAGGGGCSITILTGNDHGSKVETMKANLGSDFHVFETTLGGPGVGHVTAATLTAEISTGDLAKLKWQSW